MSASKKSAAQSGVVKQSTLVICIIFSLLAGLYGGYLLGSIAVDNRISAQNQSGGPSAPVNPADDAHFAHLQREVNANPQDAEAWNQLGHWYFDNAMPKEAIKAYESSLVLKPNDPNIVTNMGVMYRDLHEHEKALELFRQASGFDKNHLQSRFNQGIVLYFDLKREPEAIAVWSDLLKIAPDYKAPNGSPLADMVKDFKKGK